MRRRFQARRQSTPQDTPLSCPAGSAIVSLPALLELARWCRGRRQLTSGADSCPAPRTGPAPTTGRAPQSPPSPASPGATRPPEGSLARATGRHAGAGGPVAQPGGDPAVAGARPTGAIGATRRPPTVPAG